MRFQACTIIARNYLAHARVLYRSLRQFHPDLRFGVLVLDMSGSRLDEPFDLFTLDEIGLPEGEETRMPLLYDVTELATAVKPWFFRHLLTKDKAELLYFDPDIEIFSPVNRLAQLAHEHCLVLTPHTTQPMSRTDVRPNETDILAAGAYNLGFLGLNPDCGRFLTWWSERLLREAMIDVAKMRFTDQRWMDFAPGYFDAFILKDETCNVAYWNGDTRPLRWTGSGYEINGKPLCFFHFSGFKPEKPHLLSLHQGKNPRTRFSEQPVLARLCGEYIEKLAAADYARWHREEYGFDRTPGGLSITKAVRFAYRSALRAHEELEAPAPPNAFSDTPRFIEWLNQPDRPEIYPGLTRYFSAIYELRPDLQAAFPNLAGTDNVAYDHWLRHHGRYEIPIPPELIPPVPKTSDQEVLNGSEEPAAGVVITGYFRAEIGTGESGRLMTASVKASGEKYFTRIWSRTFSRQNHPWTDDPIIESRNYDTNLICMNADELPHFGHTVGPEFFRNRYNIGFWFWETEIFPPAMQASFNFVNEIWVTSEFTREAIAKVSPVPVFTVAHPLRVDTPIVPVSRAALELPESFLFLFMFDFDSVVERKNPLGLIKTFQNAFAPGEGPTLLIKSINGHRNVAGLEQLLYARANRSDIIIRDGYLSAAERDALVATCDCYVSLHRAEGFGMTIAEAMLMEKPAIATRYSGNLEFMNDANSFLCDYTLRHVGPDCGPYPPAARWAEPDLAHAAKLMRFVYQNPEEGQRRAKKGRLDLCCGHTSEAVAEFIKSRLSALRKNPPAPVRFLVGEPERPQMARLRQEIEQGANVRQTVPRLLTWIFQGPRRAMKQCLRSYEQYRRKVELSALDAFRDLDAEWTRERRFLNERLDAQERELDLLKKDLKLNTSPTGNETADPLRKPKQGDEVRHQ
jgi:glycosyltransferase involved in cell wall biosynthesis